MQSQILFETFFAEFYDNRMESFSTLLQDLLLRWQKSRGRKVDARWAQAREMRIKTREYELWWHYHMLHLILVLV